MSEQKAAQKSRRNTDEAILKDEELSQVHGGVSDGSQDLTEVMDPYADPSFQGPVETIKWPDQPSGEGMARREQEPIPLTPLQPAKR